MTTSLDTRIRRSLGMIVALTVVVCVGAGSAAAGGRPAASYYTSQQLQVMAQRWAAKAAHDLQIASQNRPSASYYTQQQLQVMAERGAAKAAHDSQITSQNRSSASYYTQQQLQVMAERGAAKAAHDSLTIPVKNPAASYYTKQQLQTMSQSWAARAALSSVSGAQAALASLSPETRDALLARLGQTPVAVSSDSSFGWSDFGIGAAGMLGIVLLAGGALLAARYGRHSRSVSVQRPA